MADFNSIRFLAGRPLVRELGSDRLNTILAEIKRNKPKGERGITVRQDGTGTYIGLAAALPRGPAAAPKQPWDLIARRDPEADPEDKTPNYLVTVQPGTITNVLAENWDEEFTAEHDQIYYAKAEITTDAQQITGVSIVFDTELPQFTSPELFAIPSTTSAVFGLFLNGKSYRTFSPGSPSYLPRPWITFSKVGAEPGELPYDIYYTLLP